MLEFGIILRLLLIVSSNAESNTEHKEQTSTSSWSQSEHSSINPKLPNAFRQADSLKL